MSNPLFECFEDLDEFTFLDRTYAVRMTGSIAVAEGVVCDTYLFEGDNSRNLGIIKIEPGCKTPHQRVVGGVRTNESYVAGAGRFHFGVGVNYSDELTYGVTMAPDVNNPFAMDMNHGNVMQWAAEPDQSLVVAEICWPPYADGRFENLS
jgi:hypothetical protein